MIVICRHIWWPIGHRPDGTRIAVPIGSDWMVATAKGIAHAAPPNALMPRTRRRRKTVDTVCGTRAHPLQVGVTDDLAIIPIWPPPARLPNQITRCRQCMTTTGSTRPDRMYRELDLQEAAS